MGTTAKAKAEIHWGNLVTGKTGHGEPIDVNAAEAWVEKLNEELKGQITHWVTVVEP